MQVCSRVDSRQVVGGNLAADPELPQRCPLIHEFVVPEGVHGDVCGQVTRPVGNGYYLSSLFEARQGARNGAGVGRVPVVDGDRQTG